MIERSKERVFILSSRRMKRFLKDARRRGLHPTRPVRIAGGEAGCFVVVILPVEARAA